jgi:hypothetical protein
MLFPLLKGSKELERLLALFRDADKRFEVCVNMCPVTTMLQNAHSGIIDKGHTYLQPDSVSDNAFRGVKQIGQGITEEIPGDLAMGGYEIWSSKLEFLKPWAKSTTSGSDTCWSVFVTTEGRFLASPRRACPRR